MPDDPIFEPGTDTATDTAPATPAETPAGMTAQETAELVPTSLKPVLDQIQTLAQGVADLAASNLPPPAAVPEVGPDDFLTEDSQDPKGKVQKIAAEVAMGQLKGVAPLLSGILQQGHGVFVDKAADGLDSTFGKGAYEAILKPDLDRVWDIYQKQDMTRLGDGEVIARHFNEMKGIKMDELIKYRDEFKATGDKQAAEENKTLMEQVRQDFTTNMTGGIRMTVPDNGKPGPEVQQYLDDIEKATGEKQPDAVAWAAETDFPSTLEGYRAKVKADKEAAKKTGASA